MVNLCRSDMIAFPIAVFSFSSYSYEYRSDFVTRITKAWIGRIDVKLLVYAIVS